MSLGEKLRALSTDDESTIPVLAARLGAFEDAFINEAGAAAEEICQEVQAFARANHPWQRRTGLTDETTVCTWSVDRDGIAINLSAGSPYAIFLEHNPKWAWLAAAMLATAARQREIWLEHLT